MYPVLFEIPGVGWDVTGYGVALMIGLLLSIMWAAQRAVKSGANPDVILNCGFLALIGGVLGSRVMYVAHYWDDFAHQGGALDVFKAIIDVRRGGLEVYGGVLTVVILVLWYLWRWKHSIRWYLDIIAPSAALGMSLGRIGCFLNGCCWGGVCHEIPWAMRFPFGSPPAVQQWTDREPGAGVPDELLLTAEGSIFANGQAASPIPREGLRVPNAELDAARQALDELARRTRSLKAELEAATDPQERKRIQAEIQDLPRQWRPTISPEAELIVPTMTKYGLSAEEIKALAQQHPSLPVHPTQLYSVIVLGVLALLLNALYWRRTRDGQVICALFLIEPPTRWAIEVVRADNPVDTAGFTISQFLAICISALGLFGLLWLRRMPARSPRAVLWEPEGPQKVQVPVKAKRGGKPRT